MPVEGTRRDAMVRVKSPQDLGAAVVFLVIGLAGIYFGRELAFGTASRMGPGYFPTLLSWLIIAIGLVVGFRGITVEGPPIERVQLRPILFIIALLLTIFAAYARHDVKIGESIVLGVGLGLFTVVVFVYVLGQALPAWWGR
jgi:putative tricarboxylic transport membrane protein